MTMTTTERKPIAAKPGSVKREHINLMLTAMEACAEAWGMDVAQCEDSGPMGKGSHPRMMAYQLVLEVVKDRNIAGAIFNKTGGGIWYGVQSINEAISAHEDIQEKSLKARELFKKYSA